MSKDSRGPIELLQAIQQGKLDPHMLSGESRRACMEYLIGAGRPMAEVAEHLKISLRTAQRDLARIREAHSVTSTPEVQNQILGRLILKADQAISRLTKISQDRAAPHSAQVDAAYKGWSIEKELLEKLQSIGIMPLRPQQVQADIHHVAQSIPSLPEMLGELAIMEKNCSGPNASPALRDALPTIRGLLAQASAAEAIQDLKSREKEAGS